MDNQLNGEAWAALEAGRLLYGADAEERLVAVERRSNAEVTLYSRLPDGMLRSRQDTLLPWLIAERADPWRALPGRPSVLQLRGDHPLRFYIEFAGWTQSLDAVRAGRETSERFFRFTSPTEQYLVRTGKTLFKNMVFDDLVRLQIDIETLGLDPAVPENRVITIAMSTSSGKEVFLADQGDEGALIEAASAWLVAEDPDIIEGHNVFNFDLPYLQQRANRQSVALNWGRDKSALWIGEGEQRFKAGALTLPYRPALISGRHIVDTYQQIQRYDVGGRLTGYGLKPVMAALYPDRTRPTIPGDEIRERWEQGKVRELEAYNLADVRDVNTLSRLTLPTEFYQTQILPRSLQSSATGGPGEKINDLMVRSYVHAGHSLPRASAPRPYAGGHAELLATGAFAPVVKCDVESLYPSIMMSNNISSSSDTLKAALPMLSDLTKRRLEAKHHAREDSGDQRDVWEGLQSSFKVLINSFYGYLGYSRGLFNDFEAAERVTLAGQDIIRAVVTELERLGAQPIEVDTDGVYFVPPRGVLEQTDELTFIDQVGSVLPTGIRLAHDGRYAGMLSLRLKTYALLEMNGAVTLKGSALRSRRMEACFRDFLRAAAILFMTDRKEEARAAYFQLAEDIRANQVDARQISQWTMINAETIEKQPRLNRLLQRTASGRVSGERVEVYEREDGELGLVNDYDHDANSAVLLRKLRDTSERFEPLFPTHAAFTAFFPPISPRTNLAAAAETQPATQLAMFSE